MYIQLPFFNAPRSRFRSFSKIPRYSREVIVTEKIDGSNASLFITEYGEFFIGARNQWITPAKDNHGFAKWALAHKNELLKLGSGLHFGEWWGDGINRGYGLKHEKRCSLFNTRRWCLHNQTLALVSVNQQGEELYQNVLPECVSLVPVLWTGLFDNLDVHAIIEDLKTHGSYAVEGYMNPEGIVIYHVAGNHMFKKTIEKDDEPKGRR